MPTFQRCDESVAKLAKEIQKEFESYVAVRNAGVTIDFVFAYADKDERTGIAKNNALSHHGNRALGICRRIKLKDRALGRGCGNIAGRGLVGAGFEGGAAGAFGP